MGVREIYLYSRSKQWAARDIPLLRSPINVGPGESSVEHTKRSIGARSQR